MFETLKAKVQENPEQAKKIGIAVGAVVGLTIAGTLIYLNRDGIELPWNVEVPIIEPPTE